MYESEFTKFMREFLQNHPEQAEQQKRARATWWDKDAKTRTPPEPRKTYRSGGAEHAFKP